MSLWLRALEFLFWWAVLAGIAWGVCAKTSAAGWISRVIGSIVLGGLGLFVGLHDVVTLGAMIAGDYRSFMPFGWCWVLTFGGAAAALPWVWYWFRGRRAGDARDKNG
jgi:hypothetical protein